jgi:hypothetical protein
MSQDRREALVRKYLDEVFNGHDVSRLDKYLDADLVSHWLGDRTLHGLPVWRDAMAGFFAAFPDASYTLEDIFRRRQGRVERDLARDPARELGRHRAHGPEGDLDGHDHGPLRGRQAR